MRTGSQSYSAAFTADHEQVKLAFKHLPGPLIQEIRGRMKQLQDDLVKLYRHQAVKKGREDKPNSLHKDVVKIQKMQHQVSKKELSQVFPYNIADEFDKFRKETAIRLQKFHDDALTQSIKVLTDEVNIDIVKRAISEAIRTYCAGQQEAYSLNSMTRYTQVVME